jgi:uncharacterized protein (TIGR00369 family)
MMTDLSPYARKMGFVASRDEGGALVLEMPYGDHVSGRPGFVHGGALAGLLETIAYMTLADALANEPAQLKPINVTVSYMRGATEQSCFAKATIERLGKRVANVEAVAWQDDPSKPVALAQINVMLARDK